MMYGHEKSDPAIVAEKPANKAERSAAKLVERRAGTEGMANQLSTRRTLSRVSVTLDVGSSTASNCRRHPRWEPYAGKPHVRICAGGREVTRVPTAKVEQAVLKRNGTAWRFAIRRRYRRSRYAIQTEKHSSTPHSSWRFAR